MKLRHPLLIQSAALLGSWLVRGWMGTIKKQLDFRGGITHPTNPKQQRFIYAFWHETLLFGTTFRTKIQVLISQHADGELIAQICKHLRIGTIRGSSKRGGTTAILEMLDCAKYAHLGITPDGPRGPRRKVQPGTIFLASKTGLPILPFGVGYTDCWRAKSWDRFAVPKPFSTVKVVVGNPIYVPPDLDLNGLAYYARLLEQNLLLATEDAERWAEGKPRLRWDIADLSPSPKLSA